VFFNIDVAKGGTFDTEGTHELVHAEQFEDGYLSFGRNSTTESWVPFGNSRQLEQQAYEGQHTKHPDYEAGGYEWLKATYELPETSTRNIDVTATERKVWKTPFRFWIFYPGEKK
jgi:hypothetical protein